MADRSARKTILLAGLVLLATATLMVVLLRATPLALAAQNTTPSTAPAAERWLHVAINNQNPKGERVRVNLPLSLAESLLGAVKHGRLEAGKIRISEFKVDNIDLRRAFEAIKSAMDGEFVTVDSTDANVRVAKEKGFIIVKARDSRNKTGTVDVRVPIEVVDALFSGGPDELNLIAALRALAGKGDIELVSVKDAESTVRVWVDAKNTAD
jgi:hypothetical protein